jgi:hypothetical protein
MISTADIRAVSYKGAIIENYPDDIRGHSCLMLGFSDGRPLHVVCAPKDDYLAIITAYPPDSQEWVDDFKKRKE